MKGTVMPRMTRTPPITLHPGAHRTGTSTLQRLLSHNAEQLACRGVAVWGPRRTRDGGLLSGVTGDPGRASAYRDLQAHRAAGRVAMHRTTMAGDGISRLVVSDSNMLGSLRENLLLGRLYPTVSARMERLGAALPGVDHVSLSIRSPDAWWTSLFAHLMTRGFAPPDRATIDAVLKARRGWRQVVCDVADALPDARLTVWTHEDIAARPADAFAQLTGTMPETRTAPVLNAAPPCADLQVRLRDEGCLTVLPHVAGHYAPFTADERAELRGRYDDDLIWLRDGAGGRIVTPSQALAEVLFRDRRSRHGPFRKTDRRQDQMGAAG